MVSESHAVVHPRTVVVHLHDAPRTHSTVVRPGRLEGVTPSAVLPLFSPALRRRHFPRFHVNFLGAVIFVLRQRTSVWWDRPRIPKHRLQVRQEAQHCHGVEEEKVSEL